MYKWERMLIAEQAVDCESGLISDAQPALAEDVQGLSLSRKKDFSKSLVPRLQTSDFVNDDLQENL